jgi:hypothetical protein
VPPPQPAAPKASADGEDKEPGAGGEGGQPAEGGGEGTGGLDDDFDDESNLSLSAMEAALKPQVLETLDQIAALYKRLGRLQDAQVEAALGADELSTSQERRFNKLRNETVDLVKGGDAVEVVNQAILEQGNFVFPNQWPTPTPDKPPLLNVRDVLRFATINGAKHLRLDTKTGSLKPGKEADIIILDATHLNVFPVNHVPGAVVQMMDRSNVETVIVAGKVRKWKGRLLDVDLGRLRDQLEDSRNFLYQRAGVPQNVFR